MIVFFNRIFPAQAFGMWDSNQGLYLSLHLSFNVDIITISQICNPSFIAVRHSIFFSTFWGSSWWFLPLTMGAVNCSPAIASRSMEVIEEKLKAQHARHFSPTPRLRARACACALACACVSVRFVRVCVCVCVCAHMGVRKCPYACKCVCYVSLAMCIIRLCMFVAFVCLCSRNSMSVQP